MSAERAFALRFVWSFVVLWVSSMAVASMLALNVIATREPWAASPGEARDELVKVAVICVVMLGVFAGVAAAVVSAALMIPPRRGRGVAAVKSVCVVCALALSAALLSLPILMAQWFVWVSLNETSP